MKFHRLEIPDVVLIEPRIFDDLRGFFFESYSLKTFSEFGIRDVFCQDNHSRSAKGALRGLHYQIPPHTQGKLVRVVRGRAFDVAVDIRKDSPTFGKHVSVILDGEKKNMLYVPPGFAHGFCALEEGTEFFYKVTDFYSPAHERGILWNDPAIGINWPKLDRNYILSDKDAKYPALKEALLI